MTKIPIIYIEDTTYPEVYIENYDPESLADAIECQEVDRYQQDHYDD